MTLLRRRSWPLTGLLACVTFLAYATLWVWVQPGFMEKNYYGKQRLWQTFLSTCNCDGPACAEFDLTMMHGSLYDQLLVASRNGRRPVVQHLVLQPHKLAAAYPARLRMYAHLSLVLPRSLALLHLWWLAMSEELAGAMQHLSQGVPLVLDPDSREAMRVEPDVVIRCTLEGAPSDTAGSGVGGSDAGDRQGRRPATSSREGGGGQQQEEEASAAPVPALAGTQDEQQVGLDPESLLGGSNATAKAAHTEPVDAAASGGNGSVPASSGSASSAAGGGEGHQKGEGAGSPRRRVPADPDEDVRPFRCVLLDAPGKRYLLRIPPGPPPAAKGGQQDASPPPPPLPPGEKGHEEAAAGPDGAPPRAKSHQGDGNGATGTDAVPPVGGAGSQSGGDGGGAAAGSNGDPAGSCPAAGDAGSCPAGRDGAQSAAADESGAEAETGSAQAEAEVEAEARAGGLVAEGDERAPTSSSQRGADPAGTQSAANGTAASGADLDSRRPDVGNGGGTGQDGTGPGSGGRRPGGKERRRQRGGSDVCHNVIFIRPPRKSEVSEHVRDRDASPLGLAPRELLRAALPRAALLAGWLALPHVMMSQHVLLLAPPLPAGGGGADAGPDAGAGWAGGALRLPQLQVGSLMMLAAGALLTTIELQLAVRLLTELLSPGRPRRSWARRRAVAWRVAYEAMLQPLREAMLSWNITHFVALPLLRLALPPSANDVALLLPLAYCVGVLGAGNSDVAARARPALLRVARRARQHEGGYQLLLLSVVDAADPWVIPRAIRALFVVDPVGASGRAAVQAAMLEEAPGLAAALAAAQQRAAAAHAAAGAGGAEPDGELAAAMAARVAPAVERPGQHGGNGGAEDQEYDSDEEEEQEELVTGRGGPVVLRWPAPLQVPAEAHDWEDVPRGFTCAITQHVMSQPAMLVSPDLPSAPTYERAAIQKWLAGQMRDPKSNTPLRSYSLLPNEDLHRAIDDWGASSLLDTGVEAMSRGAAAVAAAAAAAAAARRREGAPAQGGAGDVAAAEEDVDENDGGFEGGMAGAGLEET
ncbi:hypothetical protein GPECTOR_5g302 [Gonium pectorale]|uniref:U-box domain-containing protein n=1 Tax=Gonium pectorale TaxID=33097 RepID=A0A150GXZ5_GONPE|nr:hypothetical protein GPECTOR_5g302 [Gonium pectorale]|eukprot:KXZ54210.1 hypothetical protein GPECTOR_5g302 [Gonium pectorale]